MPPLELTVEKPYEFPTPTLKEVPEDYYSSRGIEPSYVPPPPEGEKPNYLPRVGMFGRFDPGILGSAFEVGRTEKSVAEVLNRERPRPVEGYDVQEDPQFKGTAFERDYWQSFIEAESPEETAAIISRIKREERAYQTIADGGVQGWLTYMGALVTSPEFFAPMGGIAKLPANIGRLGRFTTRALEGAALTGAAVGAQETALTLDQETRRLEDALWGTASGVVIGALLGPIAARGERSIQEMADAVQRDLGIGSAPPPDFSASSPSSAGAAVSGSEVGDARLEHAFRVDRATNFATPAGRLFSDENVATRREAAKLIDIGQTTQGGEGIVAAPGGSVETQVKVLYGIRGQTQEEIYRQYSQYRFGRNRAAASSVDSMGRLFGRTEGKLSFKEFQERVAWASVHGDVDELVPEVAAAAKFRRENFINVLRDQRAAVDENFARAVQELEARGVDQSYLHRVWDQEAIALREADLRAILVRHFTARQDDFARRLSEVEKAGEDSILTTDRFSPEEIETLAEEVIANIQGMAPGRFAVPGEFLPEGARGAAKERMLRDLPTEDVWDFLVKDLDLVDASYLRSVGVDAKIIDKFGSLDLKEAETKILAEARSMGRGKAPEQTRKINQKAKDRIQDLHDVVSVIRGTYKMPRNPRGLLYRAVTAGKILNLMTGLGTMTVSAIPDMAKVTFRNGLLRTFRDGFVPLVNSFKTQRMTMRQVRWFGGGMDMLGAGRLLDMADLTDNALHGTRFEKGLQSAARGFGMVTGMAPWNAFWKQLAGAVTIRRALEAVQDLRAGKITRAERQFLADAGINDATAHRIAALFDQHGIKDGNAWYPNAEAWVKTPEGRQARDAFAALVVKEVDQVIVTPGAGDKPLMAHGPLGSVVFQFQSFALASTEKTLLAGLRQRDAAVLEGVTMMLGLGALSYFIKAKLVGQNPENQPIEVWAAEAIDNSGMLGILMNANHLIEKVSQDRVGLSALTGQPARRYMNVNVWGSILGPSFGKMSDLFTILGSTSSGNWTESTTHKARKFIPLQNLFYLRRLFDEAEKGVNRQFGIPMKRRDG